jgi:serine/threonine-protein kinase RsbW
MGRNRHVEHMILNIPSDFRYLGAVDAAIQDLAREFSFAPDAINDVSTALVEACSNAIEHGNHFSKDKRVVVTLGFNGGTFVATVKDEGPGFDFDKVMRDDAAPDPLSERGRGILIMRAFADEIRFRRDAQGFVVELTKLRRDGGGDAGE